MNRKILWVRLAYWAGIVADAIAAAFMLFPQLDNRLFSAAITSNPLFGLGVRRGAALMIGWTVLLFWADRKPVERRDILLITLCPVVVGYAGYLCYAWMSGFTALRQTIAGLITEAVFIAVFAAGYLNARQLSREHNTL